MHGKLFKELQNDDVKFTLSDFEPFIVAFNYILFRKYFHIVSGKNIYGKCQAGFMHFLVETIMVYTHTHIRLHLKCLSHFICCCFGCLVVIEPEHAFN